MLSHLGNKINTSFYLVNMSNTILKYNLVERDWIWALFFSELGDGYGNISKMLRLLVTKVQIGYLGLHVGKGKTLRSS